MFQSRQIEFKTAIAAGEASQSSIRAAWLGTKLAQAAGLDAAAVEDVASCILLDRATVQQIDLSSAGLSGDAIDISARIAQVAIVTEAAYTADGAKAAFATLMQKASNILDPRLAETFLRLAGSLVFWMALESDDLAAKLFAAEVG